MKDDTSTYDLVKFSSFMEIVKCILLVNSCYFRFITYFGRFYTYLCGLWGRREIKMEVGRTVRKCYHVQKDKWWVLGPELYQRRYRKMGIGGWVIYLLRRGFAEGGNIRFCFCHSTCKMFLGFLSASVK